MSITAQVHGRELEKVKAILRSYNLDLKKGKQLGPLLRKACPQQGNIRKNRIPDVISNLSLPIEQNRHEHKANWSTWPIQDMRSPKRKTWNGR